METNTPIKSTGDIHSINSNEFGADDNVDENLNTREIYFLDPTINPTEIYKRIGFAPVYGLGLVLIVLVMLSLCNAIYRRLKNGIGTPRDENIQRPIHNLPSTPPRFPTQRAGHDSSPKRFSPRALRFPPAAVHLSTSPKRVGERVSAESLETFEPWTSYRFIHPDIPNELIGPRSSTSTPESEIMPLHEGTAQMPGPFTDGVTRRKLSFTEPVLSTVSDPEGLETRRSSITKDA